MAFEVNLPLLFIGGAYHKEFLWSTLTDGVKTPVDLTGFAGCIQVRNRAGGPLLADWSTSNGRLKFPSGNRIEIDVPLAETEDFSFTEAQYDFLIWPEGNVNKAVVVMYGMIPARQTITDLTP